jgi:hypothetical protein
VEIDRLTGELGLGSASARQVAAYQTRNAKADRLEDGCDEFPGRRGSELVIPVASDPTVDSACAGARN